MPVKEAKKDMKSYKYYDNIAMYGNELMKYYQTG